MMNHFAGEQSCAAAAVARASAWNELPVARRAGFATGDSYFAALRERVWERAASRPGRVAAGVGAEPADVDENLPQVIETACRALDLARAFDAARSPANCRCGLAGRAQADAEFPAARVAEARPAASGRRAGCDPAAAAENDFAAAEYTGSQPARISGSR